MKIKEFKLSDISILSPMFPPEWNFDFTNFANQYFNTSFFKGFTLIDHEDIIGFGNLFVFNSIAWLGNIIVEKAYRNKGLGTKITNHLIDFGKQNNVESFSLIATKEGAYIYKKLGFDLEESYCFYQLKKKLPFFELSKNIVPLTNIYNEKLYTLDMQLSGENRDKFLKMHLKNGKVYLNNDDNIEGFFLPQLGYGLIQSTNEIAGIELLKFKIKQGANSIVITESNQTASSFLNNLGFKQSSIAQRMILGKKYSWHANALYSRGAGYCG